MIIYRIARNEFCDTSGEGAKRVGGRWNHKGIPALYASSSISSGLLERLTIDPEMFSAERYVLYSTMEIDCPDDKIEVFAQVQLPDGWDSIPPGNVSKAFGSQLLTRGVLCFGVPSVVDTTSLNYVLNPESEFFDLLKVRVYPLKLDHRIVRF